MATVFSSNFIRARKKSKLKTILFVLGRVIKNNPKLFLVCALGAVITSIINYNIGNVLGDFLKGSGEQSVKEAKFKFNFNIFNWKLFGKDHQVGIEKFLIYTLILIVIVKGLFSLAHYYWNNYAYDSIERDLKKDLFSPLYWC